MSLEFNKKNLVYVILVVSRERKNGKFVSELIRFSEARVLEYNRKHPDRIKSVSRSTLYNYLREIDAAVTHNSYGGDLDLTAGAICNEHPNLVDKFYALFAPEVFDAYVEFLVAGSIIETGDLERTVSSVQDNLYFALSSFLEVRRGDKAADQQQLPGAYRVYRPSLSTPGKILVSAAIIDAPKNGALRYSELMHFKNQFGWRRQLLEGHILSKSGDIALITKDSNTKFMQFTILHSLLNDVDSDGKSVIRLMAGTYTGTTRSRPSNQFQTGIFFARENFKKLAEYEIRKWKIGLMPGYGLVERNEVPTRVLDYMFE